MQSAWVVFHMQSLTRTSTEYSMLQFSALSIAAMLQGHHFVRAKESEDSASDALCF